MLVVASLGVLAAETCVSQAPRLSQSRETYKRGARSPPSSLPSEYFWTPTHSFQSLVVQWKPHLFPHTYTHILLCVSCSTHSLQLKQTP